jgi:hypothetical protein
LRATDKGGLLRDAHQQQPDKGNYGRKRLPVRSAAFLLSGTLSGTGPE